MDMAERWEYRVVYVDPRGRISCEGVEFVRQSGENRTAFLTRYLEILGQGGRGVTARPLLAAAGPQPPLATPPPLARLSSVSRTSKAAAEPSFPQRRHRLPSAR